MYRSIKEIINLSHTNFISFAYDFVQQLMSHGGDRENLLAKRIVQDLETLGSLVYALTSCDAGRAIDRLEERRYRVWENIVEVLDDNLGLKVVDPDFLLPSCNLTEKDALLQIPSYAATWNLLEPGSDQSHRVFPTRASTCGHFWRNQDMGRLIARLIDPSREHLCKLAGIAETVELLRKLELELTSQICRLPAPEAMDSIREQRYKISLCMKLCLHTDLRRLKKPHSVEASTLVENRIHAMEEKRRMEMFSLDHLSPGSFLAIIKRISPRLLQPGVLTGTIREEFPALYAEFTRMIDSFKKHPQWDDFDGHEGEFYRSCVNLLDRVAAYIPCYTDRDGNLHRRHTTQNGYFAAMALLKQLNKTPYDSFTSWTPDQIIGFPVMDEMIYNWADPANQKLLQTCQATEMYESCAYLYDATATLAEKIMDESPPETLFRMRHLRYILSLIPGIAEA